MAALIQQYQMSVSQIIEVQEVKEAILCKIWSKVYTELIVLSISNLYMGQV